LDEGKGTSIENIINENLKGSVETKEGNSISNDIWIPLEDGDPVEQEDKWGKRCPPQFAINFKTDLISIKCNKKSWFSGSLSKFTFELWLRPKSDNGIIIEIGQGINHFPTIIIISI